MFLLKSLYGKDDKDDRDDDGDYEFYRYGNIVAGMDWRRQRRTARTPSAADRWESARGKCSPGRIDKSSPRLRCVSLCVPSVPVNK